MAGARLTWERFMTPTDTGIPDITFIDLTSYVGLTATGLLTFNLLLGLLLSTRYNPVASWPHRRLPLYDLHNWTGYVALAVVLLHPVMLLPSATAKFGWLDIVLPFWAPEQPVINTIGAFAAYALIFVVVTSYYRNRIGIRTWKKLHYVAYAVTVTLFAHSLLTNPNLDDKPIDYLDGGKVFVEACTLIALAAITWRVLHGVRRSALREARAGATHRAVAMSATSFTGRLRVARIFQETPTVRTLRLVDLAGGPLPFAYRPGQFLTLTLPAGGQVVRRTYTIASAPTQAAHCEVTVKREPGGAGSVYLHDQVREGDEIAVSGPSGRFTFTGAEADSVVLIGGGVGVTPLMSVLRALMDRGWDGEAFLLYAVRSPEEVIFEPELALLAERNPNLRLLLVAEEAGPEWQGAVGRVTPELLAGFVPDLARRRVHLCGPAPMMAAVQETLTRLGMPEAQVLTESFGVPFAEIKAALAAGPPLMEARVTFRRSGRSVSLAPPQTLVDAAEAGGIKLDYSCRSGTCGTCRVRVVKGTVAMARHDALLAADEAEGMVLACQARPTSAEVLVDA